MKIAIVGPSPVPFTIGGVENALMGLHAYINESTPHACELIKLPVREDGFWNLLAAYRAFYDLDLSHYDAVISTKYPAWMVRHPNHICYMFHCLRGFYDTFRLMNLPEEVEFWKSPYIRKVCAYMESSWETPDSRHLFELVDMLGERRRDIPAEFFAFPHPFIRRIVRYLDHAALSQVRPDAFFALSETVRRRTEYFPENVSPRVLYLPSHQKGFRTGDYRYFFTVSRLDSPKRIDLAIKAMKHVGADVELLIAGRGPEEANLRELAAGDRRIRFLGFVNDEALKDLYADALAVVFVPYDEDYGLITIEAMMSRKPVITCSDSGGTTEFVRHGETGYVAEPNARSLGKLMDAIACDPGAAARMGEAAHAAVSGITWQSTVEPLLAAAEQPGEARPQAPAKRKDGRKITVASPFAVFPPKGGGQSRTYNIYKHIARDVQVEIVSMAGNDMRRSRREIAPGLVENVIPKTNRQAEKEWHYESQVGCPVSDSALPLVSHLTPDYGENLRKSIEASDLVVLSHPHLYHEAVKYLNGKPFIYEAQDVEYALKQSMYKNRNKHTRELLATVFENEKRCCIEAVKVVTCSEEDIETLSQLYGVGKDKMFVVPNGVDCEEIRYLDTDGRARAKRELGLDASEIALFVGSWHQPNIEAAEFIIEQAPNLPQIRFIIAGSVCNALDKGKLPENVGLLGVFSEGEKKLLYKVVDIALNPMFSGSGTNLKMFDYFAAGIPVVSSLYGTRGIADKEAISLFETADEYVAQIRSLAARTKSDELLMKARRMVEESFDWKVVARRFLDRIELGPAREA